MKKTLYLFVLALLLEVPVSAQTPIWQENFQSQGGWTLEDNWSIAGQLLFDWSPIVTNYDLAATSPVISVNENSEVLIINQFLEPWPSSVTTERADISILVDEEEIVLWSYELADGVWGSPTGEDLVFPFDAYAGKDIQFKFRSYGPTTDAWMNWKVFQMEISGTFENDLCAHGITGPNSLEINETGSWFVEVKNFGQQAQSDYIIELYNLKSGDMLGSATANDPLAPGESAVHLVEWIPVEAENTALYANVAAVSDDFQDNNTYGSHFLRIHPDMEYDIYVWDMDNGIPTIIDPEKADVVQPSEAIERALDYAGFSYLTGWDLPSNINDYEVILATLGCYCLS